MALTTHVPAIRNADPEQHAKKMDQLVKALESGAHQSTAAAYAGISQRTLARWIAEGGALAEIRDAAASDPSDGRVPSYDEQQLIELYEKVSTAEAKAEVRLSGVINDAAEADWRAALALLERRFKARWSPRSEVTGADGGALQVENRHEQRLAVLAAIGKIADRLGMAEELVSTEGHAEVVEITRHYEDSDQDEGEVDRLA